MRRAWALCAGLAVAVACAPNPPPTPAPRTVREALEPLHRRLGPPREGDWLWDHPEYGQTFEEYVASVPTRATGGRRTLYVGTLGAMDVESEAVVRAVREFLGFHFGLPVSEGRLPGHEAPASARRRGPLGGDQLLTGWVLGEVLPPRLPADGAALLAFTESDLWPGEGWNFVFGQATWHERVGVFSLARLKGDGADGVVTTETLRRALKLASHEACHMFSMRHCTAYACGMNGSNHLAELDRNPLELCPECLPKLVYATGVDRGARFAALEVFARSRGLAPEAELYRRSSAALASQASRSR